MKNKKTGICLAFIVIVLLCVLVGWWRGESRRVSRSFEKISYVVMDGFINWGVENDAGSDLVSYVTEQIAERITEQATELVASPKLNIDLEEADFFVTDNRGGEYSLGYPDKETFLKDFGFEGKEPFYQYVEETSGEIQMELYYDEETTKGCGIRYFPKDEREAQGFVVNTSTKPLYSEDDYLFRGNSKEAIYSKLTVYGSDPSMDSSIDNFKENTEYTDDGKIKHYIATATGWFTNSEDETEPGTIMEMDFVYRKDGSLQRKDYFHNSIYQATTYQSLHSFYDKEERLVYEDGYITHGSLDHYYIYEGEEKEPSYYLTIDHNLSSLCATMFSCHDYDAILYQEVLEEFERLWNADYEKENLVPEEAKYAGEYFINAYCKGEKEDIQLCYNLQDLSGDGICELLIGIKYKNAFDEEVEVLQNIFTYQDGKISNIFRDENQGSQYWGLCEGNVIEVSRAVYGYGDYWYYVLRPGHEEADLIDTVGYDGDISRGKGEEMYLYYDGMKNEISKEEFEEVLSKYPKIEISWKELKGFSK